MTFDVNNLAVVKKHINGGLKMLRRWKLYGNCAL